MKKTRPGKREILLPPLWDHHGHLLALGALSEELDLRGSGSPPDLLRKIEERASKAEPGEWITGFGWDQNLWKGELPSPVETEKAALGHPLFIRRIDCHAAIANSSALRLAGLDEKSEIPGGKLESKNGKWTGVAVDNAMEPFTRAIAAPTRSVVRRRMRKAFSALRALGLSGASDMQLHDDAISVLQEMDSRGEMDISVVGYKEWTSGNSFPVDFYRGERFVLAGLKVFLDGALGSRGAALRRPYSDDRENRGILLMKRREILGLIEKASAAKVPLAFHAIGDRALEEFLCACESSGRPLPQIRVEHLQVTPRKMLERLAATGATVSLQPSHFLSDAGWAGERLGPSRFRHSYLLRSIIRRKRYLLGTDFPIEPPDPLRTIAASLSRPAGESLTLAETLKGMACPSRFSKHGRPVRLKGFSAGSAGHCGELPEWELEFDK